MRHFLRFPAWLCAAGQAVPDRPRIGSGSALDPFPLAQLESGSVCGPGKHKC